MPERVAKWSVVIKHALQEAWALPFFVLGWAAGRAVRLYRVANAALVNGWHQGVDL